MGGRQDRDEWMHVAMLMTFELYNQQAHALYCHSRPSSLRDNILGHVPVDCYSSKVIHMATCIHSSLSCLPPIPIFPLLNRKIFHLLVQCISLLMKSIVKSLLSASAQNPLEVPDNTTCRSESVLLAIKIMDKSSQCFRVEIIQYYILPLLCIA